MTAQQRKKEFDNLARQLSEVRKSLAELLPELTLECDQKAAKHIRTDLDWAVENCTVIGLHQIGESIEDNMGFGRFEKKPNP